MIAKAKDMSILFVEEDDVIRENIHCVRYDACVNICVKTTKKDLSS